MTFHGMGQAVNLVRLDNRITHIMLIIVILDQLGIAKGMALCLAAITLAWVMEKFTPSAHQYGVGDQ